YASDLWWQFSLTKGDAPRFLRATVGAAGFALAFAMARLLKTAPSDVPTPAAVQLDLIRPIVAKAPATLAHLALVGDKALLFNESETAFIMYAVEKRSWVALGDPVG